nr:hypothetical protein Hi04_10k_c3996_00014 [uncultured bacterium]
MSQSQKPIESARQPARKPYSPPRVISYGHVKDLVQGNSGHGSDGGGGAHSKSCWIAEALYGVSDPRTHLLRAWLTLIYDERRPGWMFVALYRRFGRRTASLIERGLLPRLVFQPLFDALVEKALADSARAFVAARH